MPQATNKTEFMRWLDAHPEEVDELLLRYREYRSNFRNGTKFGGWMRQKYLAHFTRIYNSWWLRRPELYGTIYQQQEQLPV